MMAPHGCRWDDDPDDDDEDFIPPTEISSKSEVKKAELRLPVEYPKVDLPEDLEKVKDLELMKPVPLETKKLLYKGFTKQGDGRAKYLKARYKDDPEDKYYSPVCSSWDYGWTYGQDHELQKPEHGRTEIMKTSFFRHNDPQLKPRDRVD